MKKRTPNAKTYSQIARMNRRTPWRWSPMCGTARAAAMFKPPVDAPQEVKDRWEKSHG